MPSDLVTYVCRSGSFRPEEQPCDQHPPGVVRIWLHVGRSWAKENKVGSEELRLQVPSKVSFPFPLPAFPDLTGSHHHWHTVHFLVVLFYLGRYSDA